MDDLNIKEARKRLSSLVDACERGERTRITRRGKQVAVLSPVPPEGSRRLPDLSEFRRSISSTGPGLSQIVVDARDEERY